MLVTQMLFEYIMASHFRNGHFVGTICTILFLEFLFEYYKIMRRYSGAYLPVYLLTPWCRVLLEKLTGLQLVKKFPAFHGTRRFIIALTNVRHLSLSGASPIQSIYPHPTSWSSFLILSTHLRLGLKFHLACRKQVALGNLNFETGKYNGASCGNLSCQTLYVYI